MKTLAILSALLLSSCASVSITNHRENPNLAPSRPPTKITVQPTKTVFLEDSEAGRLHKKGALRETLYLEPSSGLPISKETATSKTGDKLTCATNKQLGRFLRKSSPSGQELLIESRITTQHKGSRALRVIVGLGAGKTLMETKTRVFNTNKSTTEPWLEVWTTGSSNREPGAVFAAMPSPLLAFNILAIASTGVSIANGSGKGLSQDAKRTGKTVAAFILEKLKEHGQANSCPKPKYHHSIPVPLSDETIEVPLYKQVVSNKTKFLQTRD